MADEAKVETKPAEPAKKITLQFRKAHEHNGKVYQPGDKDVFTQEDADLIRAQGTATTVTGQ